VTVEILRAFETAGIRYVVVGGVAAIVHGATRRTEDLDICYASDRENLELLAATVNSWEPHLRVSSGERIPFPLDVRALADLQAITLETSQGSLDLLQTILGVGGYEDCLRDSIVAEVGDIRVRILGLQALIRSKEAAARGKDLRILPELREALIELRALRELHRRRQVDPATVEPAGQDARSSALALALRGFAESRAAFLESVRSSGVTAPPPHYLDLLASIRSLAADPEEPARLSPELRPLLQLATTEIQRWKRLLQGGREPHGLD
jgi:hypothetical protein